jgi:predicted RNA-binding Zn-ribbon protein involved in translation (DUF1610 family)
MGQDVCQNLNHRRTHVTVRFCPECGEVVNKGIPIRKCSEGLHAIMRRKQNNYCVRCGAQLIRDTR